MTTDELVIETCASFNRMADKLPNHTEPFNRAEDLPLVNDTLNTVLGTLAPDHADQLWDLVCAYVNYRLAVSRAEIGDSKTPAVSWDSPRRRAWRAY